MSSHNPLLQGSTETVPMTGTAWSELLHAEVAYLLREAGVPVLHIKGPSVARWLYPDGGRMLGDVDIMVPAKIFGEALDCLEGVGMEPRFPGVTKDNNEDHAVTLVRRLPDQALELAAEVDVHHRFPGIGVDPDVAFDEFWRRREPEAVAHINCWFPDLPSRALLLVLNTARGSTPQGREDLRRLLAATDDEDWQEVISLASRLDALPALRIGLGMDPEGVLVGDRLMSRVGGSTEWALRVAGAPRTALRLVELSQMERRRRWRQVLRWLFPAPAIMRMREPGLRVGRVALTWAYLRRLASGMYVAPGAVAALLRARRDVEHERRQRGRDVR